VQNGTSGRAHQPATAYIESDVRTSEAIIQSRRSALLAPRGRPAFGVHDICGDSGLRQHPVRQGGRSLSGGNPTSAGMHVATITFTAATPGTYQYLCAVPGHAQRGMLGNFVVTG
jgi:hypothetical protein